MSENLIGYNGKIAYVNLTDEKVEVKDLNPQVAKNYLGGTGLSAKLTYDLLSENDYEVLKRDPYSEINPLIFATGPVTGTTRPSSGRYSVTAISPLTGIWGEGTSGGYFPISLRNSGFDAIVITGKAKKPSFLYIHNEIIEIKDANSIWGKDTYESQTHLKEQLNNDKVRIATIGIAGENLVNYAGIFNDEGRAIGRSGMGTIMGSKNLKALAIHGTNRVKIADSAIGKQLLKEDADAKRKDLLKTLTPFLFTLYGTNCYLDMGMALGDTPGYYFTRNEFFADKLTGKTLREEYPVLDYGCWGCTMRCGKTTIIEHEGKEIRVDGPEYESVTAFGPLLGVFDSKKVILSNHMCNVYGFDTISGGVSIAFLIYLVENNLGFEKIKKFLDDIDIGDVKWGNGDVILKLLAKIAKREGIGNILADGVRAMAKEFNVDPELAAHVKGLEIPMHDPRAFAGQALSYMTCYMGANHEKCDWFGAELMLLKYPKIRVKPGNRTTIKGREKGITSLQDLRAIDDSATNCNFINPPLEHIIKYINASTNFDYNRKSLMLVGERINTLKRLISCKLGITREDDKLPKHVLVEMKTGKTEGIKLDMDDSLKEYYKIRAWDWETGWPSKEKLDELNI
jgi:aldehyde:ferredoxin oxidoreductase